MTSLPIPEMKKDLAMDANGVALAAEIKTALAPVVFFRDGVVFANTNDVATFFEKEHRNVLRDVDGLLRSEHPLVLQHFTLSYRAAAQNRQNYRSFDMTRDGFMLLAMGFTGAKALKWKMNYIEAFNIMEAELLDRPAPAPLTREQTMAQAYLFANETMKEQAEQIAVLTPKAEALDRIAAADGSFSLQEAAKLLQVRPKDLNAFLLTNGWLYRRSGSGNLLGYQAQTSAGLLMHKVTTIHQNDGIDRVCEQVKVTPRGLAKLAKLMPGRLVVVT